VSAVSEETAAAVAFCIGQRWIAQAFGTASIGEDTDASNSFTIS
jgi:hypothetical protein